MLNILKKLIEDSPQQAITYEEYMNAVLYDETCGYYMKHIQKIGKQGDFITSSNFSNVFGMLFSKVFSEVCTKNELPFLICEIGGGNGRFAKAVLEEWKKQSPETFDLLTYIIIEKSPYHLKLQQEILLVGEKVLQYASIEEIKGDFPQYEGIIISNELFDAFPVRVIEKHKNELVEIKVSIDPDGNLCERVFSLEDDQIINYLNEQKLSLKENQRFEVPLAMITYLQELSHFLTSGLMITIDYGYTNEEWMLPYHQKGSLRGYLNHQMIKDPLKHPSEMDLTTHISFDALQYYGEKNGLQFIGKLRQDEFLIEAGILEYLQDHHDHDPFSEKAKQNRAIRSLIMNGGISESFHVVIQAKNLEVEDLFKQKLAK
ncbi:class I SAM-dependent methyltransferase [Litchfieldia alkalitelluris]|uniref:class I SAM-dependent methyltransferase n=1 Tax=Litchfieldia alkalitelluris TaxID=304268 RepID=UPI00195C26B3|nr:SAM-dependent methyltransferase [Litchfieldia alkalitelluris]